MSPELLRWIANTPISNAMRDIFWLWPVMENLHFLGLSVMFGALLAIDLRVIGLAPAIPMRGVMKLIPLVLMAFAVNLLTGIAFIAADPYRYFFNLSFQWKMGLIAIAGVNALWFWLGEHKKLVLLGPGEQADFAAKVIALISLAAWIGVIIFGRLIPYLE